MSLADEESHINKCKKKKKSKQEQKGGIQNTLSSEGLTQGRAGGKHR